MSPDLVTCPPWDKSPSPLRETHECEGWPEGPKAAAWVQTRADNGPTRAGQGLQQGGEVLGECLPEVGRGRGRALYASELLQHPASTAACRSRDAKGQ